MRIVHLVSTVFVGMIEMMPDRSVISGVYFYRLVAGGMQLKSGGHDIFDGRGYQKDRREQLKISIIVRLG